MDYKVLDELNRLRKEGALTEEEFQAEKKKLFEADETKKEEPTVLKTTEIPMGLQESAYLALMNFLILVPYIGWIIPFILWVVGKHASPLINQQGKYIMNWFITWVIFGAILTIAFAASFPALLFSSSTVGLFTFTSGLIWSLPFIALVGIVALVFPIIGGIKGLSGETWKYPLSIPFLK